MDTNLMHQNRNLEAANFVYIEKRADHSRNHPT